MSSAAAAKVDQLDLRKFKDPELTATGEVRASVRPTALQTLWFNTGTLCNLTCANCYIESSPTNDRLAYLSRDDVQAYLDEIAANGLSTQEIGFTGGEPFMNPDLLPMIRLCLTRGFRVLVLTNAMRPMMKSADDLLAIAPADRDRLTIRVSLDHYARALHETERGARSWEPTIKGIKWLSKNGFRINIAGRLKWGENEAAMRNGYRRLFAALDVPIDAANCTALVLFPEMDEDADVPEITESCWDILDVHPDTLMCATSRMIVKHKGAATPVVMPCTLLPYDHRFVLGPTLADGAAAVRLNHPHCARFCVLGGGSCSVA